MSHSSLCRIATLLFLTTPVLAFERFVDPLPIPPLVHGQGDLVMKLTEFKLKIHRDLPPVSVWGYNGSSPGPTIEVESGTPIRVHWINELPTTHLFPAPKNVDMGDASMPDVRTVTHLHGAAVSETDPMNRKYNNDGWPDAWIVPGQEQITDYPNPQSARMLWYHDHAMAETGRNVAAGLAGMYVIRDAYERSLNLPSGKFEFPLFIQAHGLNPDGSMYYTSDITSEFYGNSVSVNGKLWPYLDVQPRKYRFRFVNGSNARSYSMKLVDRADQSAGPAFYQIGTDSGFLQDTAVLNDPDDSAAPRLVLAPAERADVIIDFSKYAGHSFLLMNNQLDPGDAEIKLPQIMLFNVAKTLSAPDKSSLPLHLRAIRRLSPREAAKTRQIVLGQMLMANGSPMLLLNGKRWNDPIEERPRLNSTEIWELVNTLSDTHPFHIHLVQFQILDRTPFNVEEFQKTGKIVFTGKPIPPDANEMGWKDVVRTTPASVTRIIMRFGPYPGYYVYHCHILEHEDMDMMRPFQVMAP